MEGDWTEKKNHEEGKKDWTKTLDATHADDPHSTTPSETPVD